MNNKKNEFDFEIPPSGRFVYDGASRSATFVSFRESYSVPLGQINRMTRDKPMMIGQNGKVFQEQEGVTLTGIM